MTDKTSHRHTTHSQAIDLNDEQLLHYNAQIMLPEIDISGQQKLLAAHILIIGVGGLGTVAALYLAAAGIGQMTLADPDRVELTNLQRQISYNYAMQGEAKVKACQKTLNALNPEVSLATIERSLQGERLEQAIAQADIILDCTDNLNSRFAINKACFKYRKPLVCGAAIRWEGQLSVFVPAQKDSPCYQCFHNPDSRLNQTCSANGVLGPVVGVIGSMQAIEAIKLITGAGEPLTGQTLLFDALSMQWQTMQVTPRTGCEICGQRV